MKPEPRGEHGKQKRPSAGAGVCPGPGPSGMDVGNRDLKAPWPSSPCPWLTAHCVMNWGVHKGKLTAEGVWSRMPLVGGWVSNFPFAPTFLSALCL